MLTLASAPERLEAFRHRHGDLGQVHYGQPGQHDWDGCLAGHREIWQQATQDTLVLEDDVVLAPRWQQILADLQPPPDWDLIYLGGQHIRAAQPTEVGLVRCRSTIRTHAYVMRQQSVPRLLAATDHQRHVDLSLACAQQDGEIVGYAVHPWIAGQGSAFSAITHRQEPERWWRSYVVS